MNRKQALIGLAVYHVGRIMLKRMAKRKGGRVMANKKTVGILAGIGAALGALMFWRKRKQKQQEFFQT